METYRLLFSQNRFAIFLCLYSTEFWNLLAILDQKLPEDTSIFLPPQIVIKMNNTNKRPSKKKLLKKSYTDGHFLEKANEAIMLLEEAGFRMIEAAFGDGANLTGFQEIHQSFENSALQV